MHKNVMKQFEEDIMEDVLVAWMENHESELGLAECPLEIWGKIIDAVLSHSVLRKRFFSWDDPKDEVPCCIVNEEQLVSLIKYLLSL